MQPHPKTLLHLLVQLSLLFKPSYSQAALGLHFVSPQAAAASQGQAAGEGSPDGEGEQEEAEAIWLCKNIPDSFWFQMQAYCLSEAYCAKHVCNMCVILQAMAEEVAKAREPLEGKDLGGLGHGQNQSNWTFCMVLGLGCSRFHTRALLHLHVIA